MEIIRTISPLQTWVHDLYERHGTLTPELVRDAARPPDSPAHGFVFNVEPGEAADRYYLDRAHELIRTVKVKMIPRPNADVRTVRFFVAIPGGEESLYVYESITELEQSAKKLELARKEAVRRLNDAERSVADLDSIAPEPGRSATATALKSVRRAKKALAEV